MKCHTCQQHEASEKISVTAVELEGHPLDPHEPFHFCSIFCRNVFVNNNKAHLKFSREYGNTTARIGMMG